MIDHKIKEWVIGYLKNTLMAYIPYPQEGVGGAGEIFYVAKGGSAAYNWLNERTQEGCLFATIQAALDKTVADRNDYVYVYPSGTDYDITTSLTMTKKAVHLICKAGISSVPGATNGVRVDQTGAYVAITISGQACEVAGFFFKGAADKTVIEISASAHCANIHHNFCAMRTTAGSATAYGIHGTGESSNLIISDNFVSVYYPTATKTVGGGIVLANGTRAVIKDNIVTCGGFAQTMTKGITAGSGAGSLIIDNVLYEGTGPTGAGVFTKGITVATYGAAFGNRIAMSTVANSIDGGTADKCAVGNYDSTDGSQIQDVD